MSSKFDGLGIVFAGFEDRISNMELDEEIMLRIFEMFIDNPDSQLFDRPGQGQWGCYDEEAILRHFPIEFSSQGHVIRWHLIAFLNEFVLDRSLTGTFREDARFQKSDYLNWSGKCLYAELKAGVQENPNEE